MSNSTSSDDRAIDPAQIAALSVSILAILVFTSMSIYLCGRHRGWQEATRTGILRIAHLHHLQNVRIRIPDEEDGQQKSEDDKKNKTKKGGRFAKLKKALGMRDLKKPTADADETGDNGPRTRSTSPLQIQFHSGPDAISSSADEFQAAVHNLLGYTPGELNSDDDEQHEGQPIQQDGEQEGGPDEGGVEDQQGEYADQQQQEQDNAGEQQQGHEEESAGDHVEDPTGNGEQEVQPGHSVELFSVIENCGSPLPPYEEVEPWRFSWQGDDEATYRPEKREPSPTLT